MNKKYNVKYKVKFTKQDLDRIWYVFNQEIEDHKHNIKMHVKDESKLPEPPNEISVGSLPVGNYIRINGFTGGLDGDYINDNISACSITLDS